MVENPIENGETERNNTNVSKKNLLFFNKNI